MKFLDIRSDYAFKKIFAEPGSKQRLLSLLNAVFPQEQVFCDLTVEDPYNLPALENLKETWVDIKATLDSHTKVLMEMQRVEHHDFKHRILYNTSRNYGSQLVRGEQYGRLKPVFAVTVSNFNLFDDVTSQVNFYQFRNESTIMPYNDEVKMAFIELPKFNKSHSECSNDLEHWIYFMKHAGDSTMIPNSLPQPVQDAWEAANEANMTPEELEFQRKRFDFHQSIIDCQEIAEARGEVRGVKAVALNLLRDATYSDAEIAQLSGLSHADIQVLKAGLNKP